MPAPPATLADELRALNSEQRADFDRLQALHARAAEIAAQLGFDESDVFHTLQQLERTPTERLRRGLAHGRRRPRVSY
ncbi:MAG: hypothetical protein ACHREM_30430 [Polyangiales bacterium]